MKIEDIPDFNPDFTPRQTLALDTLARDDVKAIDATLRENCWDDPPTNFRPSYSDVITE